MQVVLFLATLTAVAKEDQWPIFVFFSPGQQFSTGVNVCVVAAYKGLLYMPLGFPGGSVSKESACNTGDLGSIPRLGRSPGEGNGYPCQYSGRENSMDCIVHGVAKSQTQQSDLHLGSSLRCILYIHGSI